MKKFVKLSLVAAVAVAGLTTANAKPLEEAIKDVDVSGTVVYRYNDYEGQKGQAGTTNNYKVGVSLSSKVNDDVKFNSRIVMDQAGAANNNLASLNTTSAADADLFLELTNANFSYTGLANTTVIVGKQGLQTPWTNAIDSDGPESTGTGILALTTFGPVTAAAGLINQHNVTSAQIGNALGNGAAVTAVTVNGQALNDAYLGSQDMAVAALITKIGPVNAEAWYLDFANTFDSYFLKASGSFDIDAVKIGLFAQHTDLTIDNQVKTAVGGTNDYSLTKAGISAKMGIFGASYTYGKTGKDGSAVLYNVAPNGMIAWSVDLSNETEEAKMHFVTVDAQVMDNLNVAVKHAQLKRTGTAVTSLNDEEKETYVELTYNMSKNLSTYLRLGSYKNEVNATSESESRGRLQVQYSF